MKKHKLITAALGSIIVAAAPLAQGAVTWTTGAPGGTSGGALDFGGDPTTDRVLTGIAASTYTGDRGGGSLGLDYTISMWVNADTAADNQWWLGNASRGIHLGIQNGSTLESGHWSADTSGSTVVAANTWVHATFSYDADGGTGGTTGFTSIYLNGTLDGSGDAAAPLESNGEIQLGARRGTLGPAFNGKLDDVAFWDSVLSAGDILDLANGTQSAIDLGALAYYDFEDDQTGTTAAVAGAGGLGATTLIGITAVPEPSSLALVILGAAGFLRRKRH